MAGGGGGEPAAGGAEPSPRATALKAEEAAKSRSKCYEKQGQHLTPPKSLRACDGAAVGARMGVGRAVKGQRGKGQDPESISRASRGGGLLQNFVQSEGKASRDTGASRSTRPVFSIRWGKESKRRRNMGERKTKEQVPARAPSRLPSQGTAGTIPARQAAAQLRLRWRDPRLRCSRRIHQHRTRAFLVSLETFSTCVGGKVGRLKTSLM